MILWTIIDVGIVALNVLAGVIGGPIAPINWFLAGAITMQIFNRWER